VPERRIRLAPVIAAGVLLALGGALWAGLAGDGSDESDQPEPAERSRYYLAVSLGQVKAFPVEGRVRKGRLAAPAEAVRQTMAALYTTGFVDPSLWAGGRFPSLFDQFARESRGQARRDLGQLSLGRGATRLVEVRPDQALLRVRFLLDARRRPVTALAAMEFSGVGVGAGFEVPIRHSGEYVLRPTGDRWLIVGYDVRGRLGSGGGR
jgi:hypothetical protein